MESEQELRERVKQELRESLLSYIDGDAENGPRVGVVVTEEDLDEQVDLWIQAEVEKRELREARTKLQQNRAEEEAAHRLEVAGWEAYDREAAEEIDAITKRLRYEFGEDA